MPYLIMVGLEEDWGGRGVQKGTSQHWGSLCSLLTHRSSESPQAMTETLSGSPMGKSSSGRKTPEFPTSTHFFNPME